MGKKLLDIVQVDFITDKKVILEIGKIVSDERINEIINNAAVEAKKSGVIVYLTNMEYSKLKQDPNYTVD